MGKESGENSSFGGQFRGMVIEAPGRLYYFVRWEVGRLRNGRKKAVINRLQFVFPGHDITGPYKGEFTPLNSICSSALRFLLGLITVLHLNS